MKSKQYKRVGWVVETCKTTDHKWFQLWITATDTRSAAIDNFDTLTSADYRELRAKQLARLVPLYVEASDGE